MPLPSIEIPSYELKLTTIEEKIPFRPFLVKEEKILYMALESGETSEMTRAMKQIIKINVPYATGNTTITTKYMVFYKI